MSKNKKVVLICENSGHKLDVVDKDNYILEGTFCVFGRENVNHRIYEEDEYFPHLEYLQEKISKRKLVGELDHPEKFDVSLQNVSHIVEKLWYDKPSRTLKGRIHILDTEPHGMNARKLVDAGFPISVSSRAAGVVKEDKKVQIKRIFTYDFVADGGFGDDAEMTRVSESLGFDVKEFTNNESNLTRINESLGLFNDDNIQIYDVTDKYPAFLNEDADFEMFDFGKKFDKNTDNEKIYNKNTNETMKDTNFVSVEEMFKYSLHVKEEVARIDKNMSEILEKISSISANNNTPGSDKLDQIELEMAKMKSESTKLAERMSSVYKWSETISKDHNWLSAYVEKIAEDHNHLANYTEKIAEDHNHVASYVDEMLRPTLEHTMNYADKLAEDHNYVASYVDETLRPLLEQTIGYTEKVAEKANIGLNYVEEVLVNELHKTQEFVNDVIVEKLNTIWNYAEYLGEKSDQVHHYSNYIGKNAATREDLENVVGFAEAIQESKTTVNESASASTLNENTQLTTKYKNLGDKIDNLLHSIKTQKIDEHSNKYSFLSTVPDEQAKKFINFSEIQKEQIAKAMNPSMKQEEIKQLFESVENPVIAANDRWLQMMPEAVRPLWENASSEIKERIGRQARLYVLNNEYAVRNFWTSRVNLLSGETAVKLNENVDVDAEAEKVKAIGYGSDYIKNVMNGLDRFNR